MKSEFVITLVSLRLLALATKPFLARSNPLRDLDGNEVKVDQDYYVVSAIWGIVRAGDLTLFSGRDDTYPLEVVQGSFDMEKGTSLRFATHKNTAIIDVVEDLNLQFSTTITSCSKEPVWRVDDCDESSGKWFITTGGVEGNPS